MGIMDIMPIFSVFHVFSPYVLVMDLNKVSELMVRHKFRGHSEANGEDWCRNGCAVG